MLFGAFFLGLIFYLVFAIYGMSLFMGKFYTCNCEGEYNLPIRSLSLSGGPCPFLF